MSRETALRAIGDRRLYGERTLILRVPSAVVPEEPNYLINPHHPDFPLIRFGNPSRLQLDPRLFRTR